MAQKNSRRFTLSCCGCYVDQPPPFSYCSLFLLLLFLPLLLLSCSYCPLQYFVSSDVGGGKQQWYGFHKEPMNGEGAGERGREGGVACVCVCGVNQGLWVCWRFGSLCRAWQPQAGNVPCISQHTYAAPLPPLHPLFSSFFLQTTPNQQARTPPAQHARRGCWRYLDTGGSEGSRWFVAVGFFLKRGGGREHDTECFKLLCVYTSKGRACAHNVYLPTHRPTQIDIEL